MSVHFPTHRIVEFAIARPRTILWGAALLTVVFAALTVRLEVDTDPENMLPADHPVRELNADIRDDFGAHDMIVLGVIADDVRTPEIMGAVDELTRTIATEDGVIGDEIAWFASATGGEADVSDQAAVDATVAAVGADRIMGGNVLSADGTTAAVFIPLVDKSEANGVQDAVKESIAASPQLAELETHVAGLPLAEEVFGQEMFIQMGIFAPLAGLLIFGLMLLFFRKVTLVLAAMAVAMLSVVWTMGLLIGTGNTLHIMSSMIPIFLMPIAILDSIHVLSEFFDRYPHHLDRKETLRVVYGELFRPLAYTSLTTAVAFASLAIAPIPPVRVFGLFVAFGVAVAWLATIVFIPAFIMTMSESRLAAALQDRPESKGRLLTGGLRRLGRFSVRRRVPVMVGFGLLAVAAVPAIAAIQVNDNPVNWFKSSSEIRQATTALNERLPGTFGASLILTADRPGALLEPDAVAAVEALQADWESSEVVGSSAAYVELDQLDDANPVVATLIDEERARANLRLQLSDGDNQAMRSVVDATEDQLVATPLPAGIQAEWAGETYLNLVWQDEMVSGMLEAFLSTLLVVIVLMAIVFRSIKWAFVSVLPVLWTVMVVYGVIGLVGKDYDMPIAVLSTLVLGIGVDFAIHFVQRFRELDAEFGDRRAAVRAFFEEPARALTRNALVIAIGFTPLFFASLMPYLVVGAFLSSIILLSWLTTLILLPAMVAGSGEPDLDDDEPEVPGSHRHHPEPVPIGLR